MYKYAFDNTGVSIKKIQGKLWEAKGVNHKGHEGEYKSVAAG